MKMFLLLLLFSLSLFAGPCDQYFISSEQYLERFSKVFNNSISVESSTIFNSMSVDHRVNLLKHLNRIDVSSRDLLYKTIKKKPETFLRGESSNYNRIYIESMRPGFAKKVYKKYKNFSPDRDMDRFSMPNFRSGNINFFHSSFKKLINKSTSH